MHKSMLSGVPLLYPFILTSHSVLLEDRRIEPKKPFWSNIYKDECSGNATSNGKGIWQRGNITDLVSYTLIGNDASCLCCSKRNLPTAFRFVKCKHGAGAYLPCHLARVWSQKH